MADLNDRTFLWLLLAVSVAFAWILSPLYGSVLWGVILAIMFTPLYRRWTTWLGQRRNLAALVTLVIIVLIVILPSTFIVTALVRQAAGVYERMQSGDLDFNRYLSQMVDRLPDSIAGLLDRFGLTELETLQGRLSAALMAGSQSLTTKAINVGQRTFEFLVNLFVMLYVLFFLLRDGEQLLKRIRAALPLRTEHQRALFDNFALVIRATIKGTIVVALVQGALGGVVFWLVGIHAALFWGVVMALLSLLPAVGPPVIWVPAAVYFFATGAVWRGIGLVAFGVLVIGLVDNALRPMLVGKETRMPDYLVLISTLGGLAIFGFNGFVIGPVIAALFIAAWSMFAASRRAD